MKSSKNKKEYKSSLLDDDDKAVLELNNSDEMPDNETIIEEYENSGLVDQGEQAITYSVEGLYKNKKMNRYRSSLAMQTRPPELKIESSDGTGFSIHLTEKLNRHLKTVLTDVDNAYMGKPKVEQHVKMDEWRLGDGVFDKFVKYFRKRYSRLLIALVWLLAGLLYASSFTFGGIVLSVIGTFMVFAPTKNEKRGATKDE